jgi:GntR family transcriptional repressor for pyruvate dehydrogenase complex
MLLTEELNKMEKMKDDPQGFVQADVNFHLLIGRAASNSILMNALNLIRNLLQQWILGAVSVKGVAAKACAQHRRVLLAIKARDGAAARKAMAKHLHDMASFLPKEHSARENSKNSGQR